MTGWPWKPQPPTPPQTRTIGVIVRDTANENVNGARVTLWTGQIVESVTTHGLATLTIPAGLSDTQMGVYAEGYYDVDTHINVRGINQVWIGGGEPGPGVICLPPMRAVYVPSVRPTREQIMRVCADFAYTPVDGMNSSWQSYAYAGWTDEKRAEARRLWHQIGMTHVGVSWALDYKNAGPAFDFRTQPDVFRSRLKELRDDGFVICLAACQEEAYGRYGDYDLASNLRDISRWSEWGWTEYIDLVWPGWESNDFIWFSELREVLIHLRTTLGPEQVIAVQPGHSQKEAFLWSDDGPDTPQTMGESPDVFFWQTMHDPRIALDVFFLELASISYEVENWREEIYARTFGAAVRVSQRIRPLPDVYPFAPYRPCVDQHNDWRGSPYVEGDKLIEVVDWEGPGFLRWPSWKKSEASAIVMLVPGVIGVGDGVAEVPRARRAR